MGDEPKKNNGDLHVGPIAFSPRITLGNVLAAIIFLLAWYGGQVRRDDRQDAYDQRLTKIETHYDQMNEAGTKRSHSVDDLQQQQINGNSDAVKTLQQWYYPLKERVDRNETNVLWLMERQKTPRP
jgi:hypothetical protein